MHNITDIEKYNIVGTLSNNPKCSVWIASLSGNNDPENLFIINRLEHNNNNLNIFKEFFSYYTSESKDDDIVNFFGSEKYFYIIFKYSKGESIEDRFEEDKLTDKFEKRYQILYSILMKLNSISNLPLPAFIALIKNENICIDINDKIQIIYNLDGILDIEEPSNSMIYKRIADIIKLILKNELKNKYNNQLDIILEKCENNLFSSIPQLIVELKKIEKTCTEGDAKSAATELYNKNKAKIKKYYKFVGIGAGVIFLIYLGYSLFFSNNIASVIDDFTLGNINYISKGSDNNPSIENTISVPPTDTSDELLDLSISPDTEIAFNDYVVQYGDTFESICENNYSSKSFISTIKSFNNLYVDSQLVAGMIIKLPDEATVKTLFNI